MITVGSAGLHLLCTIGGTAVALPATGIEAVVRYEAVVPVPGAPPAIRGLAAIRSRMLTLVDCGWLVANRHTESAFMAIVTVGGHGYGLMLDDIDDVVELPEPQVMPAMVTNAWNALDPLLVDFRSELRLVVEPEQFISLAGPQLLQVA